jgi:23S rRNA (pseudouridine1915-N3)-methyltransferase
MKIVVTLFGKPKDKNILELVEMYKERIGRYQKIDFLYLNDFNGVEKYLEKVDTRGKQIYLLDEDGTEYSTKDFTKNIYEKNLNAGVKEIVFGIGPAQGWGDINVQSRLIVDILAAKNIKIISLSKMAMQHDLAFLVLVEQLYRAVSIKNNLPYHKI